MLHKVDESPKEEATVIRGTVRYFIFAAELIFSSLSWRMAGSGFIINRTKSGVSKLDLAVAQVTGHQK